MLFHLIKVARYLKEHPDFELKFIAHDIVFEDLRHWPRQLDSRHRPCYRNNFNTTTTLFIFAQTGTILRLCWDLLTFIQKFETEMNRFICALRNGAAAKSQQRDKQPSTLGNPHCCGEVDGS